MLAGEVLSSEALGSLGNTGHEGCWAGREAPRKAQTFVHEPVLEYGRKP